MSGVSQDTMVVTRSPGSGPGRVGKDRARAMCTGAHTRARAPRRLSLSVSTMSLCSCVELSASRAVASSFLNPETFSSSCSRRPWLKPGDRSQSQAVSSEVPPQNL